jgi:methyl-galactoside transport system substrate-binding protein
MNDSQNDQSKQNDQIDVLLAKGVKALAINLVDPAAAGTVIEKARPERSGGVLQQRAFPQSAG